MQRPFTQRVWCVLQRLVISLPASRRRRLQDTTRKPVQAGRIDAATFLASRFRGVLRRHVAAIGLMPNRWPLGQAFWS
jgi:hypothetical protein